MAEILHQERVQNSLLPCLAYCIILKEILPIVPTFHNYFLLWDYENNNLQNLNGLENNVLKLYVNIVPTMQQAVSSTVHNTAVYLK